MIGIRKLKNLVNKVSYVKTAARGIKAVGGVKKRLVTVFNIAAPLLPIGRRLINLISIKNSKLIFILYYIIFIAVLAVIGILSHYNPILHLQVNYTRPGDYFYVFEDGSSIYNIYNTIDLQFNLFSSTIIISMSCIIGLFIRHLYLKYKKL